MPAPQQSEGKPILSAEKPNLTVNIINFVTMSSTSQS